MSEPGTSKGRVVPVLLLVLLVGCGSPGEADAPPPGPTAPGPGVPGAPAAASTAPSPAVPPAPAPRAARIAARASPSVEECIEQTVHDAAYDAMGPRDARRKLRRLEAKTACEQQLAAR
jgi:hypothetical protein